MTSVDNAQGHMTKKCELEMYFSLKGFDIFPCLPSDLCDFTFSVPARLPSDHGAGRSQASRPSEEIRYCKQTNQWNNKKKISATPQSGRVNVLFVKDTTSHHHSKSAPARMSSPRSALSVALHNALRIISHIYSTAFHFSPSELISLIPGSCHCRCAGSSSSHNLV